MLVVDDTNLETFKAILTMNGIDQFFMVDVVVNGVNHKSNKVS